MNDYISLRVDISPCTEDAADLFAAYLADAGYESFMPDKEGLTAFVKAKEYSEDVVRNIIAEFPIDADLSFHPTFVKGEDWNSEWEKNYFQPIVIADKCVVHSSFHHDVPKAELDIVIDPKMAFGTGHHSTTNLMLTYLLSMDLKGKKMIDVGTGTAILAILAAMKGAEDVKGIEIDEFACQNASENVGLNNVEVEILLGDARRLEELDKADILVANINRNIILADLERYADALKDGGTMLLSGFYEEDVPVIEKKALEYGLLMRMIRIDNKWAAVKLIKAYSPALGKNILVTICARGGSKGIPGKNIKEIGGKPLIAWTIDIAKKFAASHGAELILSTDSDRIRQVAAEWGLSSEYKRPDYLANDTIGKPDAIREAMLWAEAKYGKTYDYVVDLDVTSPIRTLDDIEACLKMIEDCPDALTVFSVSPCGRNPYFNMVEKKENGFYGVVKDGVFTSRQTSPKVYDINGSVYVYRRESLMMEHPRAVTPRTLVYEMPHICFDLDEPSDYDYMAFLIDTGRISL